MSFADLKAYLRVKNSLYADNENMKKIGAATPGKPDYLDEDNSDDAEPNLKKVKLDPLYRKAVVDLSKLLLEFHQPLSRLSSPSASQYGWKSLKGMILLNDKPIEGYSRQELLDMASPSMYGDLATGTTKLDTSVRNSFEISPKNANIVLTRQFWETIETVKSEISLKLYSTFPIDVEFNKINVYDKGGFFKLHQDTPYDDVVGSFVIVLPSYADGGDLLVYEDGKVVERVRESRLPSAQDSYWGKNVEPDPNLAQHLVAEKNSEWVSFYPEMLHEVEEIISGFRVSLSFHVKKTRNLDRSLINTPDWVRGIVKLRVMELIDHLIAEDHHVGFILEGKYSISDYGDSNFIKSAGDVALLNMLRDKCIIRIIPVILNFIEYEPAEGVDGPSERILDVYLNRLVFDNVDFVTWELSNVCFFPVGSSFGKYGRFEASKAALLSKDEVLSAERTGNESRPGTVDNFYYTFAVIASEKTKYWLLGRKIFNDLGVSFQ